MTCIITVEQLKDRCEVDATSHCWHWQGGTTKGRPFIYTVDYRAGTKRGLGGPLAAWHIAHQRPPLPGALVYRCCGTKLCVNPAHMRLAFGGHRELNAILARSGRLKGLDSPARLRALEKAREIAGQILVPEATVLEIRAAPPELSNVALASRYGCHQSTVALIRRGLSRRGVTA